MNNDKIYVYCVPGLGASISIYEFLKLPKPFEVYLLPWMIPKCKESISDYAKRMCTAINHDNIVLLGVSFGGIMVQEMSKHMDTRKIVVISSVKTKYELPKRLHIVRDTKLYKLLPTTLFEKMQGWEKLFFGETNKKIAKAYEKYMTVLNKQYLDWAIENVLCWQQKEALENTVHIHGSKDHVFPIENIKDCIVLENGTHAAILRRSKWFNENLPRLILKH